MHDNLVSIIVPVFNAEKYLTKCINSLLNQSHKNIEVILIDDGSTDNSGIICDEFAMKNKNVKVIHQNNAGPSKTRNVGIDAAQGKYIQFVDSDDFIEPNMTEILIKSINNGNELVICGYKSMFLIEGSNIIHNCKSNIDGKFTLSEFMLHFGDLFRDNFINSLWNKLYITNLIRNHNVRFIDNLHMGEDLLFNLAYIKACKSISIINKYLYNYVIISNNSLTVSFKKDYFINQQMLFLRVKDFLLEANFYEGRNRDLIKLCYTDSIITCIEHLFHNNSNLTAKRKKEQIKTIIYNDYVKGNISYFKNGNFQKRVIGLFIQSNLINCIFYFFKAKTILRNKLVPLFKLFRKINQIVRFN
ncbi:glycosyltransferase [Brevibacterium sp. PAMC23299]|nr:glycosyltransferase [Brevibacterium sp. PAMC23299]